jgi:TRAP transporter 4TM/12TM fusion protein
MENDHQHRNAKRESRLNKIITGTIHETVKSETVIKPQLSEPYRSIVKILSIFCALFVILSGIIGTIYPYLHRVLFLGFILPIVFIKYPARRSSTKTIPTFFDILLSLLSLACVLIIAFDVKRILWRIPFLDKVLSRDVFTGIVIIFCVIEACRRIIGWTLVILTCTFIAYALWGNLLPGMLAHGGTTLTRLIEYLILMSDGLFSSTAGIGSTYVFTFVAFGALLSKTRLGDAIFNIAKIITHNALGAPAKIAVISSAFMAMISGSAVANVVTTGSITIPMMKKIGFKPHVAGAVEVASSVGGQITPPIMGSGIFIMAVLTGTPLVKLLWLSVLPAILYYIVVYVYVDNYIKIHVKSGEITQEKEKTPSLMKELKVSILYFLPVVFLCVLMFVGFSPYISSSLSIIALLLTTFIDKSARPSIKKLLDWFDYMTMSAITVSTIIVCSALVVGVIFLTGFVVNASSAIVSLANGSLFLVTILAMIMCVVLGTSLPITASYLIISILGVPAFTALGVPVLSAHIAIFWFSQVATITPPVCTTSFLAADIAGAKRFLTGFTGLKFAKGMLIIPFLLVFNDLIVGTFIVRVVTALVMLLGLLATAYAIDGFMRTEVAWPIRIILMAVGLAAFYSSTMKTLHGEGLLLLGISIAIFTVIAFWQINKHKLEVIKTAHAGIV